MTTWLLAALVGCSCQDDPREETDADTDAPEPPAPLGPPSGEVRRLSTVELRNTLLALTGTEPAALDLLPPDSLGHGYDRVSASQTVSPAHLDAFLAIGEEVATTLVAEARLDEITPACADVLMPPAVASTTSTVIGATLGVGPEWSVQDHDTEPTWIVTRYAPDPIASYAPTFPVDGTYRVALDLAIEGTVTTLTVLLDGAEVARRTNVTGATTVEATVLGAAGPAVLEWRLETEPDFHNLAVTYQELRIEGPVDDGDPSARAACAASLVDELAPRAWRRPLEPSEREALLALYEEGAGEGATGFVLLFQALLGSPHFLYLVEVGTPGEAEGTFVLDDHEVAARLAYAICESPPDEPLRDAADAGELRTPAQIDVHARRLLGEPCARDTVRRFLEHWLWVQRLEDLNKSPEAFPEWSAEVRDGLRAEATRTLEEQFWSEEADLGELFTSDHAWIDPRSAPLYGLSVGELERTALPPERVGVLGLAGVMAATAPFESTSPVERGVFVLEQLLCAPLPPPPADLMVAPPPPDPGLTTRERWAQHSSDPQCSGCHSTLDPIGFAFEGFDGIGRYRTEEQGRPVDTSGGLPPLGLEDGTLDGAAALSTALADSPELATCAARQWLRFALGRLEQPHDDPSAELVAAALRDESLREGVAALFATEAFLLRYEAPPEVSR